MAAPHAKPEPAARGRAARPALAVPDLRRPQLGGGEQRPLPHQSRARSDRAVGGVRSADPDRLRQRPSARGGRGRPGRRPDLRAARHADPVRGHPARADQHLDDHQRDRALAARAVSRGRRAAGGGPGEARRHRAERPDQGVSGARHLHLPAAPVVEADRGRDRVHRARDAEVEPDQRLLLSPPGGRRHAGPGARLRARQRDRGARSGARRRSGVARRFRRRWSAGSASSSTPASASSPRCARCARSSSSGTRSPRRATASPTRSCAAFATACRSTRSASPSSSRRTTSIGSCSRRSPWCCRSGRARGRCSCRPGTRRSACRGRGTSSGACACSRSWPTRPICSSTTTCSTAPRRSQAKVEALVGEARAEIARIEAMGGALAAVESGYMKQRLVESSQARLAAIAAGSQPVVGVNCFTESAESPLAGQRRRLSHDRSRRPKPRRSSASPPIARPATTAAVAGALEALRQAATLAQNIMPASIACARAGATTGEWAQTLREVFGEYRAPTGVSGARAADRRAAARGRSRAGRSPGRAAGGGGPRCWSASRGSTVIPTAPSRSRSAPATAASRWSTTASG